MIRRSLVASAFLALALPTLACAQVELKYKYTPGRASKTTSTTKVEQTLMLAGQTLDTKSQSEEIIYTKMGEKVDGLIPIQVKSLSTKINLDLPGGLTFQFDSAKPDEAKADPAIQFLVEALKRISGMTFRINLNEDGTVKTIEGTEKLLENSDLLSPQALEIVKTATSADNIKREFSEKVNKFEPGLVRKGDTWERTEFVNSAGQKIKFKKKYEYQGTEKKDGKELDKIGVKVLEAVLEIEGQENAPTKITKSDLKVVSSEGWILFDRAAGVDVEAQSTIKVKGPITLNIAAANMDLDGEIEFTIESNSKTTKAD